MTFQQERTEKKLADPTITEEQRISAQAYLDMWAKWRDEATAQEITPAWQKDNMEYDLRTCEPMLPMLKIYMPQCVTDNFKNWMSCLFSKTNDGRAVGGMLVE